MNAVYVSLNYFGEDKIRDSFTCGCFNWIGGSPPAQVPAAGSQTPKHTKNNPFIESYSMPLAAQSEWQVSNSSSGELFPDADSRLLVKVRHGPSMYECKEFKLTGDGSKAYVKLHENDQGLAAGQYAVFYQRGECLGCGVIE
jgi:tRNA-5-taurinomethyluridine 2-sulfurtransferase